MLQIRHWSLLVILLATLTACGGGEDGSEDGAANINSGSGASAAGKVLTIYFAGTGFTVDGALDALGNPKYEQELLSTLYHSDTSDADLSGTGPKYKFFVDGVGSHNCLQSIADPLGTCIGPLCCRGFAHCLNDAIAAFNTVGDSSDLILNLIGFSRGGVSPMQMARWVSDNNRTVKKINILAYDPVPGLILGDPVGTLGADLVLPDIVNQYVGIYARDERSFKFEPIIPEYDSRIVKDMLISVRGSHETMDGNLEIDGHSATLVPVTGWMFIRNNQLKNVSNIAMGIAERLLSGPEWGELGFSQSVFVGDARQEFLGYVDGMYAYPAFDYWMMHSVSFLVGLFGTYDLAYELLGRDHHMLISSLLPPLHTRLAYRAPYRHASEYIWWLPPFWWTSADQVYLLDQYVKPINGETTWARLEYLRGQPTVVDTEAPVPNTTELPIITGECSVTLTTEPTATDNIDGTITGTTNDPLFYTEQGSYTVTWTYTDKAGNSSSQPQTILVEDTTPPSITVSAEPDVLWPPNHKLVEVNLTVETEDNCSSIPTVVLTSVVSNPPGEDDHDKCHNHEHHKGADIQDAEIGTEDYSILLRAERKGYEYDRFYTITYTAADEVGNSTTGSTTVTVPHDMGHGHNN